MAQHQIHINHCIYDFEFDRDSPVAFDVNYFTSTDFVSFKDCGNDITWIPCMHCTKMGREVE